VPLAILTALNVAVDCVLASKLLVMIVEALIVATVSVLACRLALAIT
jgi:hypothetical protein